MIFDRDQSDQNARVIESIAAESYHNQRFLTIRVSDATANQEITGIVTKIDEHEHKISFSHERGMDWISVNRIISLEINVD